LPTPTLRLLALSVLLAGLVTPGLAQTVPASLPGAAAAALDWPVAGDPAGAERQRARVEAELRRGEARAALALADAAVALHPQHAPLQFLRGVALMDLGRDDEALAHFQWFAQTWPELPDPLNNIALLHARAGRLDEALQALQQALRADPAHAAARINLGHVHLALAVRAWDTAAAAAALEPALAQRLRAARALLAAPGR
jgi:tetratricopeptide (TPR) repeat protein